MVSDIGTVRRSGALRDWATATSTLVAAVLVLVGLVFVYLENQSPSRVYWVGDSTVGTVRDGLVYYRVGDVTYTLNSSASAARPTQVRVYYEPDDPSQGMVDRPNRWVEGPLVGVWFVAAGAVLVVAAVRRRRGRRRGASEPDWAGDYLRERARSSVR